MDQGLYGSEARRWRRAEPDDAMAPKYRGNYGCVAIDPNTRILTAFGDENSGRPVRIGAGTSPDGEA